jgi:hypothetical protein
VTPISNGKGYQDTTREARLYYTAKEEAVEAGGLVIDWEPGRATKTYYEENLSDAERWKIGDEFIAEHQDDEDSKAEPAAALRSPPRSDPFWADGYTVPGDAEKTYIREMTERFGPRPAKKDG